MEELSKLGHRHRHVTLHMNFERARGQSRFRVKRSPMPRNEHLLDNFLASKETRTLGSHILRLVQVKTGPGSGRELRELKRGLPAAAILIACEQ